MPANASAPPPSDRLAPLLKRAQHLLTQLTGEALALHGINGKELAVLLAIAEQPASSQLRLADRLGVDPTTLVSLIDTLEQKRLVERSADPSDRRRNVVTLSGSGRTAIQRAAPAARAAEREFLAVLAPEEVATLRRALHLLVSGTATSEGQH